jgi:hypothetical protein
MTDCLVLIQINEQPDVAFEKPLLNDLKQELSQLVTFDLDNFSEETIRQYALDLIKQSRQAAIIIEVQAEKGPHTGLVSFLNGLLKHKHPRLLLIQQGALPAQLEKMMKVLGGDNYRSSSGTKETKEYVLPFLQMP